MHFVLMWHGCMPGRKGKSNTGAIKSIDVVLVVKMLVLQHLYNLADEGIEYQVRDRLSFMRFLRLQLEDRVPDAKTDWLFRERLKDLKLVEVLFDRFHEHMARPLMAIWLAQARW